MIVSRSLVRLSDQLSGLLRERLWLQVIIAMILGVVAGIMLGPSANLVPARPEARWEDPA